MFQIIENKISYILSTSSMHNTTKKIGFYSVYLLSYCLKGTKVGSYSLIIKMDACVVIMRNSLIHMWYVNNDNYVS